MNNKTTTAPLLVTAAIIQQHDRFLITCRPEHKKHPLSWEFPGGKMEANETPQQALQRELLEELAIEVAVDSIFDVIYHRYDWGTVLILAYLCRWTGGEITHLDVADHRWVTATELEKFPLLPADQPLVERLQTLKSSPTAQSLS